MTFQTIQLEKKRSLAVWTLGLSMQILKLAVLLTKQWK